MWGNVKKSICGKISMWKKVVYWYVGKSVQWENVFRCLEGYWIEVLLGGKLIRENLYQRGLAMVDWEAVFWEVVRWEIPNYLLFGLVGLIIILVVINRRK